MAESLFLSGEDFEIEQLDCGVQPVSCKLINQSKAHKLPNF